MTKDDKESLLDNLTDAILEAGREGLINNYTVSQLIEKLDNNWRLWWRVNSDECECDIDLSLDDDGPMSEWERRGASSEHDYIDFVER